MKIFFIFVFQLFVFLSANSQQTDSTQVPQLTKEQLLRRSKTQKIIGWAIVGTGALVAAFTGFFLLRYGSSYKDEYERGTFGLVFAGSALYTFIGTRLIHAGNQNKQKALSLSFINNKVQVPSLTKLSYRLQPAVSLRLSLP